MLTVHLYPIYSKALCSLNEHASKEKETHTKKKKIKDTYCRRCSLPGSVTERLGDRGEPAPTPSESQLQAAPSWSDEGHHSLPKKLPHNPGHDPVHAPHTPRRSVAASRCPTALQPRASLASCQPGRQRPLKLL